MVGAVNLLLGAGAPEQTKHLKAQASRCRHLAKSTTDKRMAETLKLMAGQYEDQARTIERAH